MSERSKRDPTQIPEWGQSLAGWNAGVWRTSVSSLTMRSAIMGVFLLESAPDIEALRDRMDRATRWFPALRQRVVEPIGAVGQPRMVVDPHFDITFHTARFALPAPGSWGQLMLHVRRQSMYDLDRDRPLWRATLVEGLEGDKAAILLMAHHAIADGQGAIMMLAGLVDWAADAGLAGEPMPPAPAPGRTDPITATLAALGSTAKTASELGVQAVRDLPGSAKNLAGHPRRTTTQAAGLAASAARVLRMHREPLSPLMRERGTTYTSRTMDVPFEAMHASAALYGGTINDAFLAALMGGMRRYHALHGVEVGRLRVNVPVSTRPGSGSSATSNAVTIARIELDAGERDVPARFAAAAAAVSAARSEPAIPFADLAADASRLLPVGLIAEVAKASDLTASNVPGLPAPVWVGGVRLQRLYPIVPTLGAAVNVTMLSYARTHCSVGVSTDDIAVRNPDQLMECLAEGFAEIGAVPEGHPFDPLAR
jgi:diacylglycerol O-acyltransferase / wax synthase